jgi:hypothetical protein
MDGVTTSTGRNSGEHTPQHGTAERSPQSEPVELSVKRRASLSMSITEDFTGGRSCMNSFGELRSSDTIVMLVILRSWSTYKERLLDIE